MEELLVYVILLCEKLATENEYSKRLDELFLSSPENDDLFCLEWETYKKLREAKAMIDQAYGRRVDT